MRSGRSAVTRKVVTGRDHVDSVVTVQRNRWRPDPVKESGRTQRYRRR